MIPLFGLLAGIVIGVVLEPSIPQVLQPYLPIAIVAAMDALFGAFRAYLEGIFTDRVFIVSFISNVLIAAAIVYVGDQIGVGSQLATGVVVVLGIRIFTNAAAIRRALFHAGTAQASATSQSTAQWGVSTDQFPSAQPATADRRGSVQSLRRSRRVGRSAADERR